MMERYSKVNKRWVDIERFEIDRWSNREISRITYLNSPHRLNNPDSMNNIHNITKNYYIKAELRTKEVTRLFEKRNKTLNVANSYHELFFSLLNNSIQVSLLSIALYLLLLLYRYVRSRHKSSKKNKTHKKLLTYNNESVVTK